MDFFEFGKDIKYIGDLLETIRKASKGSAIDFTKAPYDNDVILIQHLLHEKIMKLHEERKK